MKTRVLLSLLAVTNVAQAQTAPAPTLPTTQAQTAADAAPFFRDVPRDHWAFAAVQRLAEAGIIQGVPPTATPQKTVFAPAPRLAIDANVVRVKTALGDNAVGVNLNVERVNQKALLVLSGTAKTEAQVHLASAIARKSAPGFAVVNQMRVSR